MSKRSKTTTALTKITKTTDKSLHPYSNSRLESMNQCPTWGVVSAQKQYQSNARAMALEAGETMHEMFAAVRIWQLEHIQKLPAHALATAERILGMERWMLACKAAEASKGNDREHLQSLCFEVLHSSAWYDDPNDNIRTMNNMELATIHYIDERLEYMENWPIYVEDIKKPSGLVGIEQTFDVTLHYADKKQYRYIGTIDGLVKKKHTDQWFLDENKTASRLDEGFRLSFDMRHQITGYCAASTVVFGFPVFNARVTGLKIRPTNRGEDICVVEPARDRDSIEHWASWLRSTAQQYETFKEDFEHAPRFTHSCNRYFRPCSLLPFCVDTPEGRQEQYSQMQDADKSPSEQAVQET